jgi:drug/metabolite transporter (DMT)-like permease
MIKIILLVLMAEIAGTAGQILFKKGTGRLGRRSFKQLGTYFAFAGEILGMPVIWLGFILMGLCLLLWLMALAGSDLSVVFPLGSMQYILILIGSRLFLKEKIDRMKLIGTLLVVIGIITIVRS